MNTRESYVSIETAKMLKEVGFDWEVNHWYADKPGDTELYEDYARPMNANQYFDPDHYCQAFSAPTLAVAQRWLREQHRMHICVSSIMHFSCQEWYMCSYKYETEKDIVFNYATTNENKHNTFRTYEDALETGINKCLIILLEEKK